MKKILSSKRVFIICLSLFALGIFSLFPPTKAEAQKTIRIPILGPMKFYFGEYQWRAAELTADLINKKGGVDVGGVKHKIELISIDTNDLLSVTDAVSAMERACNMKDVSFLIVGSRSEAVMAMMDIAADQKKLFLDVNSAHPNQVKRVKENYDRYKYYFRFSHLVDMKIIAYTIADTDYVGRKVKEELGLDKVKIALVLDKAAYMDPVVPALHGLFPAMGYEIVGTWRPSYQAKDLFAEASAIKASGAQLICAILSGPSGQAFVNAWASLEVPAAFAGNVTDAQRLAFWQTTGGACNYVASYDSIGRVAMSPTTIDFYDRYLERYGDKPGWGSPFTEGAMLALVEAIERAGSLDVEKVISELEKTDMIYSAGRVKFYPNDHVYPHQAIYGDGFGTKVSFQWRDGKQHVYFPAASPLHPVLAAQSPETAYLSNLKFEGTVEYVLPPWMVEYWKKHK